MNDLFFGVWEGKGMDPLNGGAAWMSQIEKLGGSHGRGPAFERWDYRSAAEVFDEIAGLAPSYAGISYEAHSVWSSARWACRCAWETKSFVV